MATLKFGDTGSCPAMYSSSSGSSVVIPRGVSSQGAISYPTENFTWSLPDTVTTINNELLYKVFYNCNTLTSVDLSSVTSIGNLQGGYEYRGGLAYAFYGCNNLINADLSSLTSIVSSTSIEDMYKSGDGLAYAFYNCSNLTSVDLSSLTSVGIYGLAYAFYNCNSLTSVDLSALTSVGNNGLYHTFENCRNLTSVDLSSLASVGVGGLGEAFWNCNSLTNVSFPVLTSIDGGALGQTFYGCYNLTDVYFNILTPSSFVRHFNEFSSMLEGIGTSTTHTLHFPANMDTTIAGLAGYPNFGGQNGYVILSYDLPATSGLIIFDNKTTETLYINGSTYNSNRYYHNGEETSYTIIDANNTIYGNAITPSTVMSDYIIDVSSLFTNPNTITLATSVNDLTVTFDVNGITIPAITDGNGNYSILTSGSGFNVNYYINGGSSYMDEQGIIITTGSNITQNITIIPATESQFVRPNLTSNGTMGGNAFAVDGTMENTDSWYIAEYGPWRAVDSSLSSQWRPELSSDVEFIFYNPQGLNVTQLITKSGDDFYTPTRVVISASNDAQNWNTIGTFTNENRNTTFTMNLTNSGYYKYYKLVIRAEFMVALQDLAITATQKVPVNDYIEETEVVDETDPGSLR